MAKISSVVVELNANIAQFKTGMNEANRYLGSFAQQVKSVRSMMTGFGAVGLYHMAKQAARDMEQSTRTLAEWSDSLARGDKEWNVVLADIGRGIPIIGDAAQSFFNLSKAAGSLYMIVQGLKPVGIVGPSLTADLKAMEQWQAEFKGIQRTIEVLGAGQSSELVKAKHSLEDLYAGMEKLRTTLHAPFERDALAELQRQLETISETVLETARRGPVEALLGPLRLEEMRRELGELGYLQERLREAGAEQIDIDAAARLVGSREAFDQMQEVIRATEDWGSAVRESYEEQARAAARWIEATKTPVEAFQDQMRELNELVTAGALTWEVYQRGVRSAFEGAEQLLKATEGMRSQTWAAPEAALFGSRAAYSAEVEHKYGGQVAGQKELRGILAELQKIREATEKTARQGGMQGIGAVPLDAFF